MQHPFPISAPQDADTPLHVACKAGRAEVVRALLAAGADKEATNGVSSSQAMRAYS